jgi:prephenate dehydrogenase (NADP+)
MAQLHDAGFEIDALEREMRADIHIISCHSMHGPLVPTRGQPLVVVAHRASKQAIGQAVEVLNSLESEIIFLSAREHDEITANTQVLTHLVFKCMGTAWKDRQRLPWMNNEYCTPMDKLKIEMTKRIFSNNWHVYSGIALTNPMAQDHVKQFRKSVHELFMLMICEAAKEFKCRVLAASKFILQQRIPKQIQHACHSKEVSPQCAEPLNSHLSLLAVVDCWSQMKLNPYEHLKCRTPPFSGCLEAIEILITNELLLEKTINAALYRKDFRKDDFEFVAASATWCQIILQGSHEVYKLFFEDTQRYFAPHCTRS